MTIARTAGAETLRTVHAIARALGYPALEHVLNQCSTQMSIQPIGVNKILLAHNSQQVNRVGHMKSKRLYSSFFLAYLFLVSIALSSESNPRKSLILFSEHVSKPHPEIFTRHAIRGEEGLLNPAMDYQV